eukprot:1188493-Prorocentrum_minimum.AAC.1
MLGFKFKSATVSVPVGFTHEQRAATVRAGEAAGFRMVSARAPEDQSQGSQRGSQRVHTCARTNHRGASGYIPAQGPITGEPA